MKREFEFETKGLRSQITQKVTESSLPQNEKASKMQQYGGGKQSTLTLKSKPSTMTIAMQDTMSA